MTGGKSKAIARALAVATLVCFATAPAALALDRIDFAVTAGTKTLERDLRSASVLLASQKSGKGSAQEVFADARAEYGSLLNTLYARGYYSAVIHVRLDGIEAATIAPLTAPKSISVVSVAVDVGPRFVFSTARLAPLAAGTVLPKGFATGAAAESGVVLDAVSAAVTGWRALGFAKAKVASQSLIADHDARQLAVDIALQPGPKLRFGALQIEGIARMKPARVRAIAGLPEGQVFRPRDLDTAVQRLQRTGVFKSVTLVEDDAITAPDLLGITAKLVEEKRRRYSFGAEIASSDGLSLTGQWLHRNLFGGAERLTFEGAVKNIGTKSGVVDYSFGTSLARPATFDADTTLTAAVDLGRLQEVDYESDYIKSSLGLEHIFSPKLTGTAALSFDYARVSDSGGKTIYRALSVPLGLVWDLRNSTTDPTGNIYAAAELKPFLGYGVTDTGARASLDLRGYKALDASRRLVLAARLQAGAVFGASLAGTPRDYLFYAGGPGTVRGQPYQSLGVDVLRDSTGATITTGGQVFVGGSFEARAKLSETLGLVGFFDIGRVTARQVFTVGDWQSGAGLGLRYATPVGPIRLDVALPVGGSTGAGVQVYIGLGQAF